MDALIGKKIGRLKVIKFIGIRTAVHKDRVRNKYFYECKCECGLFSEVNKANLKGKSATLSCGCLQKERSLLGHEKQKGVPRPHVQKPDGLSVLHAYFLSYRNGAKKRKLEFSITEDKFAELTSQNCYYCGLEPKETRPKKDSFATRKMNGIDRLDSKLGYTVINSAPCCKTCNFMKQSLSEKEFYTHMEKILTFRSNKD